MNRVTVRSPPRALSLKYAAAWPAGIRTNRGYFYGARHGVFPRLWCPEAGHNSDGACAA